MDNRVSKLFGIDYPIIQAGMVWCSGWRLASSVSNAGGLGLIGAGSMYPEVLREHITKCKLATNKPFGVNVPLLYPDIDHIMKVIVEEGVKIVFTSAGNPSTWTKYLKDHGITIVHVVSGLNFAEKCARVGVDAIVAEGFEAGGHNGKDETTTFCLIPMIKEVVNLPLIAAGGIATGRGMLGALALGAEGVQIGSRFAVSEESSAHANYKKRILEAKEGDTDLVLKKIGAVRLLKNDFYQRVKEAENRGAGAEELEILLGKRRAKMGIFEGDMTEGELEIGQIAAIIKDMKPAGEIVKEIWQDYQNLKRAFCQG